MENKEILKSSLLLSGATLISRLLGLVREQVMAFMFGASFLTDAFLVAYRIPNLLRDLVAEGAFSAAFVPAFTKVKKSEGDEAAFSLMVSIGTILSIITSVIGILIIFFSDDLISIFAPSFKNNIEKFTICSNLTKMMAFYLFSVSLAALFTGVLNTYKLFFLPALMPACFNVVMITCTLLLPSYFSKIGIAPIYALGIAVFFGGILQFSLQLPLISRLGFKSKMWSTKIINPSAIHVIKRLGPGLIGFAAGQINLLVTTIIASGIVGAVSWLNYAFRLFQFPVGIVGVSVANSNLVHFSDAIKGNDVKKAISYLEASYFLVISILLPASVLLMTLSKQITELIFEHGKFSAHDTLMTAGALKYYGMGLIFYGIYKLLVPTFYSLDKQKIPIYITLFSISINILLCLYFTPLYGPLVLAFGTSLTMALNSFFLIFFLYKYLPLKRNFFINLRIGKLFIAGLSMVPVIFLFYSSVPFLVGNQLSVFTSFLVIIKGAILFLSLGVGIVTYLLVLILLGEKNFYHFLIGTLLKKMSKKR